MATDPLIAASEAYAALARECGREKRVVTVPDLIEAVVGALHVEELREALDEIWGLLPFDEIQYLSAKSKQIAIDNHLSFWHQEEPQVSPEGDDSPTGGES